MLRLERRTNEREGTGPFMARYRVWPPNLGATAGHDTRTTHSLRLPMLEVIMVIHNDGGLMMRSGAVESMSLHAYAI